MKDTSDSGTATGFDNARYIELQSAEIIKRANRFGKLYLEVGGKLFQDLHATRVLPGFKPNVKIKMLQKLADKMEILICIYAKDIEQKKYRSDFGTTYDNEVLRTIDEMRHWGLQVRAVVLTRFEPGMKVADAFATKLTEFGIDVVKHEITKGYPDDLDVILSDEGCGKNTFIETTRPIVAVIAPGALSGKFATCLTQLYHEHKRGNRAGYAKYETFPVWNLGLKHPVNIAYEAATADLNDLNEIDNFHLEAYGIPAVNYNRDIRAFPILRTLLTRVMGEDAYKSPTDMGVNCVGFAITDDKVVSAAAAQEILRRRFQAACDKFAGRSDARAYLRIDGLVKELGMDDEDRVVVKPARDAAKEAHALYDGQLTSFCGAAIRLKDGTIITGKNSPVMHAASSMLLNALKHLAGLPDWIHLLPEAYIGSIQAMKRATNKQSDSNMDVAEMLITLSIAAANNNAAQRALDHLSELTGCEVHLTHMPGDGDLAGLRRLHTRVTSDPVHPSKNLFLQ